MKDALFSSETSEWLTPVWLVEMCREVMGTISVDPCSNEVAQRRIQAAEYYTKETDGLKHRWSGSVFVNPPKGKLLRAFWRCLHNQVDVSQFLWVCFRLESLRVLQNDGIGRYPFCLLTKRVAFDFPDGSPSKHPRHPNAIVYGAKTLDKTEEFKRVFGKVGTVYTPVV